MKIFLNSIGCRLNQSELEELARQFRIAGHTLVARAEDADLAVINTCAVTAAASSDSRQIIRQAERAGIPAVVVTGCYATLEPEQTLRIPGVVRVVSNRQKDTLVQDVLNLDGIPEPGLTAREPLPGPHGHTRAFIKVQDGCDNFCTYCVTRLARGKGFSRPVEKVLHDIHCAELGGTQEVVLSGVHLGSWGRDFTPHLQLRDLLQKILRDTNVPRVRLSSLEPWDLDEDFFHLWENSRLCPHLHLPLQSGSEAVLRRMARKITPDDYTALVETARKCIPGLAVTTDIIVGFPGESESQFQESLNFVRGIEFAGGHVFSYSPRAGTPAARYPEQVASIEKKKRSAAMREVFRTARERYLQKHIGQEMSVLWEQSRADERGGWRLQGLTGNYIKVRAVSDEDRWNRVDTVRTTAMEKDWLRAEAATLEEDCPGDNPD